MKQKLLLALCVCGTALFASPRVFELKCSTWRSPINSNDYVATIKLAGTLTDRAGNKEDAKDLRAPRWELSDYSLKYTIYLDDEDKGLLEMGSDTLTGDSLRNDKDYDPTTHLDFDRFQVKKGVQLLFPANSGRNKNAEAKVMFTGIAHTGGTATIHCTKKIIKE